MLYLSDSDKNAAKHWTQQQLGTIVDFHRNNVGATSAHLLGQLMFSRRGTTPFFLDMTKNERVQVSGTAFVLVKHEHKQAIVISNGMSQADIELMLPRVVEQLHEMGVEKVDEYRMNHGDLSPGYSRDGNN